MIRGSNFSGDRAIAVEKVWVAFVTVDNCLAFSRSIMKEGVLFSLLFVFNSEKPSVLIQVVLYEAINYDVAYEKMGNMQVRDLFLMIDRF